MKSTKRVVLIVSKLYDLTGLCALTYRQALEVIAIVEGKKWKFYDSKGRENAVICMKLVDIFKPFSRTTACKNDISLCSRMILTMDGFEVLFADMGINLRSRNIDVSQHFLDGAQVGAVFQEVCCK